MKSQTHFVQSNAPGANKRPLVCFIPGGPGLSSSSLRSMDVLSRTFDLVYIDPPGTGGSAADSPTFNGVWVSVRDSLKAFGRPLILCGHSFGGIYSVVLANDSQLNVVGLTIIATPLSIAAYKTATDGYNRGRSEALKAAEERYDREQTDENYAELLAAYGPMYFSAQNVAKGSEILRADKVSAKSFENILPALSRNSENIDFVGLLKKVVFPKLFIAGAEEVIFTPAALASDAMGADCRFEVIQQASHFVTFDQPEAVAGLIESVFSTAKK